MAVSGSFARAKFLSSRNDGGSNFIPAAGSVVEFLTYGTTKENHVIVLNNTCATYLARFIVRFPPRESDAAAAATAH